MREAVGGTMLMYIVFGFLLIYIFFMAVVINYGRVFRAKNSLISYIEAEEGFKEDGVESYIQKARNLGYNGDLYVCYTKGSKDTTTYFSVKLFIDFKLPMVDGKVSIPISGETSAIKNVPENDNIVGIKECGTGMTNAHKIN